MCKSHISAHLQKSNFILTGSRKCSLLLSLNRELHHIMADAETPPEVNELCHVLLRMRINFISKLCETIIKVTNLKGKPTDAHSLENKFVFG